MMYRCSIAFARPQSANGILFCKFLDDGRCLKIKLLVQKLRKVCRQVFLYGISPKIIFHKKSSFYNKYFSQTLFKNKNQLSPKLKTKCCLCVTVSVWRCKTHTVPGTRSAASVALSAPTGGMTRKCSTRALPQEYIAPVPQVSIFIMFHVQSTPK